MQKAPHFQTVYFLSIKHISLIVTLNRDRSPCVDTSIRFRPHFTFCSVQRGKYHSDTDLTPRIWSPSPSGEILK
ncbi:hypothetical protein J6590_103473, partial [Homalodisca vitripennis]